MHIRTFREDEDYDVFQTFCAGHGKWAPTRDLLPRVGIVVEEVTQPLGDEAATTPRKEWQRQHAAFFWVYKDPRRVRCASLPCRWQRAWRRRKLRGCCLHRRGARGCRGYTAVRVRG